MTLQPVLESALHITAQGRSLGHLDVFMGFAVTAQGAFHRVIFSS